MDHVIIFGVHSSYHIAINSQYHYLFHPSTSLFPPKLQKRGEKKLHNRLKFHKIHNTYPLLSRSNILKATEKLDSGRLSSVTKKMYLSQSTITHKYKRLQKLFFLLPENATNRPTRMTNRCIIQLL